MKVYFVGMHNKEGMKPLDSKTKTGMVIDRVICQLEGCECIKTNLSSEEDFVSADDNVEDAARLWWETYSPGKNDFIVLLGTWTKNNFIRIQGNVIFMTHPSALFSKLKQDEAIEKVVRNIFFQLKK